MNRVTLVLTLWLLAMLVVGAFSAMVYVVRIAIDWWDEQ
jgi:hypothetical protein